MLNIKSNIYIYYMYIYIYYMYILYSRQVAKMEGKKFFTDLRLIFSVIYSIYQFHFVVIIWTYIPTNLISVHLSVILTDLHLSENENLNVRNRCYRLQQPLDDRCTANKNGSLFFYIAILLTFLDKQHSSVQQCDQFICPAVLTFPAMNDRGLRLSESRPVYVVHWTHQPSATSHHREFAMVSYWSAFSSPSLSFSFISSSCISPATVG